MPAWAHTAAYEVFYIVALGAFAKFVMPSLDAAFGDWWLITFGAVCLAIGTFWEWSYSFRALLDRIRSVKR
jgi:hypothetical protein